MTIPKDKVVALVVVAANVSAAMLFPGSKATAAFLAALVSLPGLTIVWFRETLANTGFARGVLRSSPSGLVGFIGWCMLLFFPLWFVYQSRLG